MNNLEYGSYAPGSPDVFINDRQFTGIWFKPERSYVLTDREDLSHLRVLVGAAQLHKVAESGGKFLFSNQP
jgi:hypothetical protein